MIIVGPLASVSINRFNCRITTIVGGLIITIGCLASAFMTSLEWLIVTYSIITGNKQNHKIGMFRQVSCFVTFNNTVHAMHAAVSITESNDGSTSYKKRNNQIHTNQCPNHNAKSELKSLKLTN